MLIRKSLAAVLVLSSGLAIGPALAAGSITAPKEAEVYIIWPKNGQVIKGGKFWLRMGAKKMGIAPASIEKSNTGHHHLIIDAELPPLGEEIPSNKHYRHFGGGQTEARLRLPPGRHTLQLLIADHNHVPHNPPLHSEQITIVVR